jgi:hypothetical protein
MSAARGDYRRMIKAGGSANLVLWSIVEREPKKNRRTSWFTICSATRIGQLHGSYNSQAAGSDTFLTAADDVA